MEHPGWPALPYEEWAPTKKTVQMCTQMLGKARLALMPPQPEWLHSCLYLDTRGFTTGPMPCGDRVVSMGIDLFQGMMWIESSDGSDTAVLLGEDRCVADIWADFKEGLDDLDIPADIWEKPQELTDVTPFSENHHDCTFVPEHALAYHELLCTLDGIYEEFRSKFFGRTSIQFWWGAFDFALLMFSGAHAAAPDDRGYIMRYDLDAEHFNAGFWPGDDSAPAPGFYGYLVPRPVGCETAPMQPAHAGWVEEMGEWMMPYEAVRTCDDPRKAVLDFFASVYEVAVTRGDWDRATYEYTLPPAPKRG